MRSERELLDRLIKKKLGEGKAEFEVSVGRKQIDMVFEKEGEIWLVEAKGKLNFEALGQVLTYKKLYQEQFSLQKALKLGIVCEKGDSEMEQACQSQEVKVFILPEQEAKEEKIEGVPICGVCGGEMVEEGGEYKCKTCEYFFGMSSMIKICSQCGARYGSYHIVEITILNLGGIRCTNEGRKFANTLCPKCRERSRRSNEIGGNFVEMVRMALEEGGLTPHGLRSPFQGLTNKTDELINYCLKRMKPYFEEVSNV
jgi:hypothetical protein